MSLPPTPVDLTHELDGLSATVSNGGRHGMSEQVRSSLIQAGQMSSMGLLGWTLLDVDISQVAAVGLVWVLMAFAVEVRRYHRAPRGQTQLRVRGMRLEVTPSEDLFPHIERDGVPSLDLQLADVEKVENAGDHVDIWLEAGRRVRIPTRGHDVEELNALTDEMDRLARDAHPEAKQVPDSLQVLRGDGADIPARPSLQLRNGPSMARNVFAPLAAIGALAALIAVVANGIPGGGVIAVGLMCLIPGLVSHFVETGTQPRGQVDLSVKDGAISVNASPFVWPPVDLGPFLPGEPLPLAELVDAVPRTIHPAREGGLGVRMLELVFEEGTVRIPAHAHPPGEVQAFAKGLVAQARDARPALAVAPTSSDSESASPVSRGVALHER